MTNSRLKGMEGVFIPVKDPELSAKWYGEILGFKLLYIEENAAVMQIAELSPTVVCLVKTQSHQPMKFPSNNFGVGKYYNFIPQSSIDDIYQYLLLHNVKVDPMDGEGGTHFFTFYDLDDNPLGVCQ